MTNPSQNDYYKDKGFAEYRFRGDVDNNLGWLYDHYKRVSVNDIKFKPYNEAHKNVYICENVLPKNFVKKIKSFLNEIPFNNTIQLLNDTDNKPQDDIIKSMNGKTDYGTKVYDPKQWKYEKYHNDIYRVVPLSLASFIGSPIIELFEKLEMKLYLSNINGVKIWDYRKATWVIQRIDKGHGIDLHSDDNPWRKIAFIYYLTDNKWNEDDGGQLVVYNNQNQSIKINPTCNSIVAWEMVNQPSPLHLVDKVKSDKPRFAFVGFFV